MEALLDFLNYFLNSFVSLMEMTYDHILMVALGIALALIVGVPLGIVCTKNKHFETIILSLANIVQVVPSLAMLAILMIVFGAGFNTVVIGLFLYSLLPIIRNTFVGLNEVNKSSVEAGEGMGMTKLQLLIRVKIPLALPFILAGIRIAMVIAVGVATLAPYIGGEGLGREIIAGINGRNSQKIYAGAIVAAVLAIIIDYLLGLAQKRLEMRGQKQ